MLVSCGGNDVDPNWRPDELSPEIHRAVAKEVGSRFTVLAQPPTKSGAVCGYVTPEGKVERSFVWTGRLTLEPETRSDSQSDGLALLSFMQFRQEACAS